MHSKVSGSVDGGFETINRGMAGSNPALRTVLCLILEICLQICIQIVSYYCIFDILISYASSLINRCNMYCQYFMYQFIRNTG